MATSNRSNQRKPSGPGASVSSGRLRFAVLAATVAAFLLVPVAQAAAGNLKVNITGTGSGEVRSDNGYSYQGSPPIECSYASPGPATGECENEMTEEFGSDLSLSYFVAGAGSELGGVTFQKGEDITEELEIPGWTCNENRPEGASEGEIEEIEEFEEGFTFGNPLCFILGEGGSPSAEITVEFVAEAGPCEAEVNPCLKVIIEEGTGTVYGPEGFECSGTATTTCEQEVAPANVSLEAEPEIPGNIFRSWGGCSTHVGLSCGLTEAKLLELSASKKPIKVKFSPTSPLTLTKSGSGSGKATATGINCDESCSVGESEIANGKTVKVKTKGSKGSEEGVISGGTGSAEACNGTSECQFTMSAGGQALTVTFVAKPMKTLTLNMTGPAYNKGKVKGKAFVKGLVKSSFSCGAGCTTTTESFFEEDELELTASAAKDYAFAGWTIEGGAGCVSESEPEPGKFVCMLDSDADKTVNAEFE